MGDLAAGADVSIIDDSELTTVLSGTRPRGWVEAALTNIDLLSSITRYLDPPHISTLACACKGLHEAIHKNRVVWLSALTTLRIVECMMVNTYDLENMDVVALKNAACGPYRLSSALAGKTGLETVVKTFRLNVRLFPPPQYSMYLVPGGRWLIHCDRSTRSPSSASSRISCSDLLHIKSDAVQPSSTLDLMYSTDAWPELHVVQADLENNGFVVVVSYLMEFPRRGIEVIRGSWGTDKRTHALPLLTREGHITLEIDGNVPPITLECEYVCVPLPNVIIVWNWRDKAWAIVPVPNGHRGAWILDDYLYILEDSRNAVSVHRIPPLASTTMVPPATAAREVNTLVWREGPRAQCEAAVLGHYHPQYIRPSKLVAIIYWGIQGISSGIRLLSFNDPLSPVVDSAWEEKAPAPAFGIHSAALQTVDVSGFAIRCGRRFLARLTRGMGPRSNLEFRVRSHHQKSEGPVLVAFPVYLDESWEEAEVYDSCTILGRVLLRQYDATSQSEDSDHSTDYSVPKLAALDFIYPPEGSASSPGAIPN